MGRGERGTEGGSEGGLEGEVLEGGARLVINWERFQRWIYPERIVLIPN